MLMHTGLILLLHLLVLDLLEHRSLVTTFPNSLFSILATALPSELGTSGNEPGLDRKTNNDERSSLHLELKAFTTHLGPEQFVDGLQVFSNGLGDKSPHGNRVGKRQDAEDDVILPSDVPKGDRADLTDQEVCRK